MSLPSWERGLKPSFPLRFFTRSHVAPFVGAWIETKKSNKYLTVLNVAPFVGAWIETFYKKTVENRDDVAPFVGAWIETVRRNPA